MAIRRILNCLVLLEIVACCECFYFGCPPCHLVDCPEPSCDAGLQVLDSECGCCPICAKEDGERCGGLTNDICKQGSTCMYRIGVIIGENRTGICEPAECKRMHCDYRHYCGYRDYYEGPRLTCQCPWYECTEKYHPLCGYDGYTYNSVCHLQITECIQDHFIGLKHYGPCAPTPEPPTTESHYLATNAIPTYEDDLFNQLGQTKKNVVTPAPPLECVYKGTNYALNSMNQLDPCTYLHCDYSQTLSMIKVPGCPDGPIDPDYGISKFPIHGGWSEWEESECVGTCHGANKTRHRTCTNPIPRYEGRNCSGPSEEVLKCIPEHCNYTCDYAEWSDWSDCSVTCGMGTQTRTRGLLTNITEEESNNCDLIETRSCTPIESICPPACWLVVTGTAKFTDVNGCVTTTERPIYACDGPCDKGEECCKETRRRRKKWAVQCPGEDFWQESRFDVISECACSSGECQLDPL